MLLQVFVLPFWPVFGSPRSEFAVPSLFDAEMVRPPIMTFFAKSIFRFESQFKKLPSHFPLAHAVVMAAFATRVSNVFVPSE